MERLTEIVLFHHVQGLTAGIDAFANTLRAAGHTVHTPDLFDGRTFPTLEEGMAYAKTVGFDAILDRGVSEADALRVDVVYAGFSLGVMPAQKLAQTREGAQGALFIDACFPVTEFGEAWPDSVPFQVHGMDADPEFAEGGDLEAARELVASTQQGELFLYPGDVHLFADSSLPTYDQQATELMTGRILEFLSTRER